MKNSEKSDRFIALLEQYKEMIYNVCSLYASDRENLRDLYQEVVANMWQGIDSFNEKAKISTWIYRVTINTCVTFFRKNSRHSETISIDSTADRIDIPDASEERVAQVREMYRLIAQLGNLDKTIILLWLQGYEYEEITELTGLSRNNVAQRLHRIRISLINDSNK